MKVVTIRILALFCGYILALLKAVCSPLKKLLATNCYWEWGYSALGQKVQVWYYKFALFWPPNQEIVRIMPA